MNNSLKVKLVQAQKANKFYIKHRRRKNFSFQNKCHFNILMQILLNLFSILFFLLVEMYG